MTCRHGCARQLCVRCDCRRRQQMLARLVLRDLILLKVTWLPVLMFMQGTLESDEAELLCSSWHPPSFALAVLSELLGTHARAAGLRQGQSIRLDEGLSALEAAVGGCERIVHTPIPLSYTRWVAGRGGGV